MVEITNVDLRAIKLKINHLNKHFDTARTDNEPFIKLGDVNKLIDKYLEK